MNTLKKYKVPIFGESYSFVSDEPEESLVFSAQHVDELMKLIAEKSGISDQKRIAVLTAVQLASRLRTCEKLLEGYTQKEYQLVNRIDRELSS
jgi:cell division protein ZapA (FtsZ GTPase activity inhibitor)